MPQGGLDKKALAFFLVSLLMILPSSLCGNPLESGQEMEKVNSFQGFITIIYSPLVAEGKSRQRRSPEDNSGATHRPTPGGIRLGEGGGEKSSSPCTNKVQGFVLHPCGGGPNPSHQGLLSSCGATEGQGWGELNAPESDKELFQRVCTLCHGWAVENFFVAEGMVEGMEPICPPPYENWLPVVLTVATYQVKVQGKEETSALIPRRDLLRLVNYLNENYPKEPICAKLWKEDTK